MSQQLAYVIITPYSLHKSRTGGILSRLISRTGLDLVAARMFAPGPELVQKYSEAIISTNDPQDRKIQELIRDYILKNLSPDGKTGRRRRVMMLLFKGEDAVRKVRSVVGNLGPDRRVGESIRDTYGDLIYDDNGTVRYFEPAVLAAPTAEEANAKLKLWAQYSDTDGGLLENTIAYHPGETPQRTLVLIKPDNFRFPTGRPGNVIDFFSRTGLYIVAIKVLRMSVADAMEFYGPVREVLRTKLKDVVGAKAKVALEKELGFAIPAETEKQLGEIIGPVFGDNQFENIVRFMAGRAPSEAPAAEQTQPGSEKCIALIYEGVSAVTKIRDVLGPTDPSKAPPGSIRREFGQNIMVNAAHASDSTESATRELGIVKPAENNFRRVVEQFCGGA
ncbi:MAG: nucleoside-diphosphate kinase [Verrucomicrobia subdivision 3 bacterium]|nr:nucleoside-diphosphate kinase [Verrucomicrobiota bacterium]MCC6819145.1 nucleoside-diphosphate kinase [Limisphaerales bacterium]